MTHALMPLPTSPLVDQGSPAAAGTADACEAKDQVGTDRPIDGDADGNSRCDIGAVEAPTRPLNDLGVTVTANPTSLVVGLTNVTFSSVVQNNGQRQATGIQVVHVLSAGLEYLSCSPANACVASSADPQIIECTTPELSPATSASVVVRAKATGAGTLTDHVSVEALEYDPAAADNFASASVAASAPSADVAVTLESQTAAPHVGLPLTLVTTVTNNGPHPAAGVALTQDGLAGLRDLTVVTDPSGTCTGTEAISCVLGDLAANAVVTVTLHGIPQAAGSLETLALAQAGTGDPNAANNGVSLQLSVAAMPPDASAPGPDASEPPGPDAAQPGADAAMPGLDAATPGMDAAAPGTDAAQPGLDASVIASGPDAGDEAPLCPDTRGCGCDTGGGATGGLGLALALMALVSSRRRHG
ncbi:MAG: choice-of-anchor Q domain-containing protein [Myxococcales bacterium]